VCADLDGLQRDEGHGADVVLAEVAHALGGGAVVVHHHRVHVATYGHLA
jgi:hypothetical protein